MRTHILFHGLKYFGAVAVVLCAAAKAPAVVTIDNFDGDVLQQVISESTPGVFESFYTKSAADGAALEIIGLERDMRTTQILAAGAMRNIVNESGASGVYDLSYPTNSKGFGTLQYDGIDGSMDVNPIGLGGINLTADGANAFKLFVTFNDHPVDLIVTAYSGASAVSESVITLPSVAPGDSYVEMIGFGSFSKQAAAAAPADFASIGALQFRVDMSMDATDLWIDLIQTGVSSASSIPEPSSLVSFVLGALGLWYFQSFRVRRRRGEC